MKWHWILFYLLALSLAACGGNESMNSSAETAVYPQQITCNLAYRPNSGSRITQQDSIIIKNQNSDIQKTIGEFDFHIMYLDGNMGGERSLRLSVIPKNKATELTAQLYQLSPNNGPSNQFIGGHGFTGLTYVTDPVTNAELQFWCTAE